MENSDPSNSSSAGQKSKTINIGGIPPPPPPLPVTSSSSTQSSSDMKASIASTPKKKKHVPLPPPPPELNLDEFDSKYLTLSKTSTKATSMSTSASTSASMGIPPPPPPLSVRSSQPKATVVNMPPAKSIPSQATIVEPTATVANLPPKPVVPVETKTIDTTSMKPPVVIGAGTPHPSNYFEPPKPTPSKPTYNNTLPPLSHLAPRHSSLPVLLVPTATSKALAQKNNITLTALFQSLSHTIAPPNNLPSNHIAPRLPPFRSIGKSIVMHWNQMKLRFLDSDLLNVMDPNVTDMELTRVCAEKEHQINMDTTTAGGGASIPSIETLEGMLRDILIQESTPKAEDPIAISGEEKKELEKEPDPFANIQPAKPSQRWLRAIRSILDTCTDNLQQDLHSCPVVALLVASTNDEYYLECLKELRSVHHLPRPHHSGHYDPHSMRFFYLLLHDNIHGPKDFDEGVALIQMRQAFPNQICAVLRMNSINVDVNLNPNSSSLIQNPTVNALFQPLENVFPHRNGILNKDLPCGQALSENDIANIQRFIATLVADCIIPAMERRIFNLNVAVNNAKRGVKNVFKSFWRKPKDGTNHGNNAFDNFSSSFHGISKSAHGNQNNPNSMVGTGNIKYTYDQIESQIRLLADSLFLMRDYESALSIYRLAKDDYKSDRATVHYASVYEMMALCLYSLDPLGTRNQHRDLHSAIETALYSYTRGAEEERFLFQQAHSQNNANLPSIAMQTKQGYCNKLATRLCLVVCSIKPLHQNRHMETADLLTSASSHETPLCAAILLEQSARHYKAAKMLKKYAFHMLMAGHMYRTAKVEQHSMRCFALSHKMYDESRWRPLSIHLESALAQQLYNLGRFEVAMLLYCKLVGYEGIGRNHQKFLQTLLDIFRKNPAEALKAADAMRSRIKCDDGSSSSNDHPLREIPGIALPRVMDESLHVMLEHQMQSNKYASIENDAGEEETKQKVIPGNESLWQTMSCNLEAEIRVTNSTIDGKESPMSKDEMIDKVLNEIDQEKYKIESALKKNAKNPTNLPAKRHRSEPILVQTYVSNPMDIQLYLTDVQLVASFESAENGSICTNEYTPDTNGENMDVKKRYNFRSSLRNFETPAFLLYKGDDVGPSTADRDSYFVVEKQAFVLDPNEVKSISLAICPMMEGSLVIRGMRWKLFNDLWVYHEFKSLGPLLQDTPEHRSNRVRGEPQLLKSVISHDMPSLSLDIVNAKTSVLQGEICKWKLRVTNIGSAPASNIALKTNVPWISIDSKDEEGEIDEHSARSHCIGPSGTSINLPISKTATESTNTRKDVIYPGETAEVNINVRAFGGGRHDLYMLLRYELFKEEHSIQSRTVPFRYVKRVVSIAVFPSLNLSASLMPSYWEKDEHVLSVEMTNYRSDQQTKVDLFLHYISVASRYYRAVPIEGQICEESASSSITSSAIAVGWQERLTMHYRIIPLEDAKFITSKCPFSPKNDVSTDEKTNMDFLCLENAFTKFRIAQKKHDEEQQRKALEAEEQDQPRSIQTIRRDNVGKNANDINDPKSQDSNVSSKPFHPTSVASMCPEGNDFSSISLLCGWSAHIGVGEDSSLTQGQHHLSQLVVRPKKKKKGCPLTITSKHKSSVKHDFSRGLLRTDLEITVRNRLIGTPVEFEFSVERRPEFNIIGAESFNWTLEGGEDLTVPVQVEIGSSGVYNLQTVRLVVLSKDSSIPYVFPLQWILRVNE